MNGGALQAASHTQNRHGAAASDPAALEILRQAHATLDLIDASHPGTSAEDLELTTDEKLERLESARAALLEARRARSAIQDLSQLLSRVTQISLRDTSPQCRMVALAAIEDICLRDLRSFMVQATPCLSQSLNDTDQLVQMRAIRTLTALFRRVMGISAAIGVDTALSIDGSAHPGLDGARIVGTTPHGASEQVTERVPGAIYLSWIEMYHRATSFLDHSHDGICKAAVKFAETVVLALSFSGSGSSGSQDHFTLDFARSRTDLAAIVDITALERYGKETADRVVHIVKTTMETMTKGAAKLRVASFLTALTVLGNLSRRRKLLIGTTLPPLLEAATLLSSEEERPQCIPPFTAGQRVSASMVLRLSLSAMRSYSHVRSSESARGVGSAIATLTQFEARAQTAAQQQLRQQNRPGVPNNAGTGGLSDTRTSALAAAQATQQPTAKRKLAELNTRDTADRIPARPSAAVAKDGVAIYMRAMPPAELVNFIIQHLPTDVTPRTLGGQPARGTSPQKRPRTSAVDEPIIKQEHGGVPTRVPKDAVSASGAVAAAAPRRVAPRRTVAPAVVVPRLSPSSRHRLLRLQCRRLLEGERIAKAAGAGMLRLVVLAKLLPVVTQSNGEEGTVFRDEVIEHLMQDLAGRLDLALLWLHGEAAQSLLTHAANGQDDSEEAEKELTKEVEEHMKQYFVARGEGDMYAETAQEQGGTTGAQSDKMPQALPDDASQRLGTAGTDVRKTEEEEESRANTSMSDTVIVPERNDHVVETPDKGGQSAGPQAAGAESSDLSKENVKMEALEENSDQQAASQDAETGASNEMHGGTGRVAVKSEPVEAASGAPVASASVSEKPSQGHKMEIEPQSGVLEAVAKPDVVIGGADGIASGDSYVCKAAQVDDTPAVAAGTPEQAPKDAKPSAQGASDASESLFTDPVQPASKLGEGYAKLLEAIVTKAAAVLEPEDRTFTRILVEAPVLTPAVIDRVKADCRDPGRSRIGLSTLKDIVLERPGADRKICLDILLEQALDRDQIHRGPAVRLIANKLFENLDGPIRARVEEFAVGAMRKATAEATAAASPGGDTAMLPEISGDAAAERNADLERQLWLPTALAAKEGRLLDEFAAVLVTAPPPVRAILSARMRDVAAQLGPSSNAVLKLVRGTAEPYASNEAIFREVAVSVIAAVSGRDGHGTTRALFEAARDRFERSKDGRLIRSVLSGFEREDISRYLGVLTNLDTSGTAPGSGRKDAEPEFRSVARDIMSRRPPVISARDLILELHRLPPTAPVCVALRVCIEMKSLFKEEDICCALQHHVNSDDISPVFMRTVLLACVFHPRLETFARDVVLRALIRRRVWKNKALWLGFLEYCKTYVPQCLTLLAMLPVEKLRVALGEVEKLRGCIQELLNDQNRKLSISVRRRLRAAIEADTA